MSVVAIRRLHKLAPSIRLFFGILSGIAIYRNHSVPVPAKRPNLVSPRKSHLARLFRGVIRGRLRRDPCKLISLIGVAFQPILGPRYVAGS